MAFWLAAWNLVKLNRGIYYEASCPHGLIASWHHGTWSMIITITMIIIITIFTIIVIIIFFKASLEILETSKQV